MLYIKTIYIYIHKISIYSFINIPTPAKTSYQLALIEKVESVIKRKRWKAQFFLNGDNKECNTKTSFWIQIKIPPATMYWTTTLRKRSYYHHQQCKVYKQREQLSEKAPR